MLDELLQEGLALAEFQHTSGVGKGKYLMNGDAVVVCLLIQSQCDESQRARLGGWGEHLVAWGQDCIESNPAASTAFATSTVRMLFPASVW